jgi:RimJ/RimL family protein N-acetyltransferase
MAVLNQFDSRTARLVLRPPRLSDAERLFALFANWDVVRWLSAPPWPYTLEDAREFIATRSRPDPDFITAAITLDDELIGAIDAIIKPASAIQRERGYCLGYWLGQPYWGHGYMSEAARGFIAHVFAMIADDTLYSGAFTDNAASLRIQDKLGFRRDGEAMFYTAPHGKELPTTSTALKRARFAALSSAN